MGLGVRMVDPKTNREYHFTPARDISYFWPQLIELAYAGLAEMSWEPWFGDYLKHTNTSKDDVVKALVAYSKFCMNSVVTEIASPYDALKEAGFFDCPMPAQLVVMAKFGQLATGAFWAGIRSNTEQGQVPPEIAAIVDHGRKLEADLAYHQLESACNV